VFCVCVCVFVEGEGASLQDAVAVAAQSGLLIQEENDPIFSPIHSFAYIYIYTHTHTHTQTHTHTHIHTHTTHTQTCALSHTHSSGVILLVTILPKGDGPVHFLAGKSLQLPCPQSLSVAHAASLTLPSTASCYAL